MILEQHAFPFLAGAVLGIQACDHVAGPASEHTVKQLEHYSRWVTQLRKWIGQCEQHLRHLRDDDLSSQSQIARKLLVHKLVNCNEELTLEQGYGWKENCRSSE